MMRPAMNPPTARRVPLARVLAAAGGMLMLLLPAAILWSHHTAQRRKQDLCGVWEPILPRGRLSIRPAGEGFEVLIPASGGGIRRYPLQGWHTPYIYRGDERIYLYASRSGDKLLLLPGGGYRRLKTDNRHIPKQTKP